MGNLRDGRIDLTDDALTDLEQVIRGTIRLHELIEAGKGDSEEADAVRDTMDFPLQCLSTHEAETSRMVSAAIQDRAWISVGDRVPADRELVWTTGESGQWRAWIEGGRYWWTKCRNGELCAIYGVSHWMPSPTLPCSSS